VDFDFYLIIDFFIIDSSGAQACF